MKTESVNLLKLSIQERIVWLMMDLYVYLEKNLQKSLLKSLKK